MEVVSRHVGKRSRRPTLPLAGRLPRLAVRRSPLSTDS
ncbi:hypothetical protein I545_2045 [Mycobacterium kansasii 662]|uniref:Uncharacterized protein n=2 Tax=Mycobacterium kansasii TaxID=1768 RepID=A0A1V3XJM5_MYCKA|nr:hypothetical protein I547_3883 [Mycobacterium kansasii 824]EUA19786.1 hypothetical protein I545_2045 [Mycobacterium kansasii 662]OOK78986.1 hypothetical protein BZL30_2242 [Mycobacterium kansasii]